MEVLLGLMNLLMMSWRLGHNILPTLDNIARIRQGISKTCPRCKCRDETLIHAMKDCPKARDILVVGGINNKLLEGEYNECIDWLEDAFRELDSKAAADFLTLLWNNWNDRNNMVFNGKMEAAVLIWDRAQTLSKDFRIFNLIEPPVFSRNLTNRGWIKPPIGSIKVNVDAAVKDDSSGFGAIARDQDGFVLGGCYKFVDMTMEVIWAELEALKEGLRLAARLKVERLILESDSASLINVVNRRTQDITILGQCINRMCDSLDMFTSVHFKWVNRNSNNVADLLCNLAIKNRVDLYFDMEYPADIHNMIIQDAMR